MIERIMWFQDKCDYDCTDCYDTCSTHAISLHYTHDDKVLEVDTDVCAFCESCSAVCDENAIITELDYDKNDGWVKEFLIGGIE